MTKPHVIFVVGPTAVGKSACAMNLANDTGGEIVSADSMQVYRGLDAGTAKPSAEEMQRIPHHMIDVADPCDDYSAAEYSIAAQSAIDGIISRGKQPIVCGGSGLYVHSLLYELDFAGRAADDDLRKELSREAEEKGPEYLFAKLLEIDPEAAKHVHPNNVKRVIRALERALGDIESVGLRSFTGTFDSRMRYDARIIRLTMDREELYARIDNRTSEFFENGLLREVQGLLESGVPRKANSMQGIGYRECVSVLDGTTNEHEALRLTQQNTRRYAKRQETWFKRYADAEIMLK